MSVTQSAKSRYLKEENLSRLLARLFPGQADFNIRLRDDQWCFTVPREVTEDEIR
ncbi:Uu.00g114280.m01.CDS01 [Anthostomella pinea]|uniref:Uu.00g114280.m01.CDS01 n=1 Tax=Anthostomella pinea TaxID=933095 RepID=A0AAI8YGM0_9PEZI|nr:Uu.00g114280.m01.CDS01 [Anthostomella pinea]